MKEQNELLVSVCCITYNHAPYIRQCLDGFLMQKTNFKYEIIIHDDCSTDGTTDVVREYADKYPNIIVPIIQDVNQYQNGNTSILASFLYPKVRGKYIAICEGDDYWIDPLKLQKQVDLLEKNLDVGLCFTDFNRLFQNKNKIETNLLKSNPRDFPSSFKSLDEWLLLKAYVGPMTWCYRRDTINMFPTVNSLDGSFVLFSHFLANSKVICMKNETTAVYRHHDGGVSHQNSELKIYERTRNLFTTQLKLADLYKDKLISYQKTREAICFSYFGSLYYILLYGTQAEIDEAVSFLGKNKNYKHKVMIFLNSSQIGRTIMKLIRRFFYR